jgi:hypothetical protein
MKIKFDFMLNLWLQEVEIEGDSEEECLDNLRRMTAEEILEHAFIKDSDLSDVDGEIVEQNYEIKVENIKYDISVEDIIYQLEKEGIEDPSPDEIENKLVELEQTLPTSFKMAFTCAPEDLEDYITDTLSDETGMLVKDFTYTILKTY